MKISYSAPAKVILSGEHAVVYGKPALVSAVNLRLKFSLWEESIKINNKSILQISQKVKKYLTDKNIAFKDRLFNFKIESEIPIGRGLGSSAALSVASVASFLDFYTGRKFEKKIINDLAYQIEKYFHQNPSGVDNTASCFGGLILYQKKSSFINISGKIPKIIEKKLFLIDSGKPKETTGEMVNSVRVLYSKNADNFKNIFNILEKITIKMKDSFIKKDTNLFKICLVDNEKQLDKLEVVSKKTKVFLEELSRFGFGKITGAGGKKTDSGFILFLTEDKQKLTEFLKGKRIDYYQFIPDYEGLKHEKN